MPRSTKTADSMRNCTNFSSVPTSRNRTSRMTYSQTPRSVVKVYQGNKGELVDKRDMVSPPNVSDVRSRQSARVIMAASGVVVATVFAAVATMAAAQNAPAVAHRATQVDVTSPDDSSNAATETTRTHKSKTSTTTSSKATTTSPTSSPTTQPSSSAQPPGTRPTQPPPPTTVPPPTTTTTPPPTSTTTTPPSSTSQSAPHTTAGEVRA